MDVHLELDPLALKREHDPTRTIAEAAHHAAQEQAIATGVHLRHTHPIDVYARTAVTPTGTDVLLVATRWTIDTTKHLTTI